MATSERTPGAPGRAATAADREAPTPSPPDRPARGVIWGLLISVPLFWVPVGMIVGYLVSRSGN
jgi:hypothetical protein